MKSLKMLVAAVVLCSASAFAQTAASSSTNQVTDQDIALMRQDISTAKMDVITHTMAVHREGSSGVLARIRAVRHRAEADWRSEDCADQRLRSELRHDG